jgi:UDP-GlcNAc:undecaprenyl-phosphate/decaprenyl-phosphate GlcNAc-1-phosphate transferase
MEIVFCSLTAFLVTYAAIPVVISLAKKFNCFDVPGVRRFHKTLTPKWGGAAFIVGTLPVFLLTVGPDRQFVSYVAAAVVLVAVGLYDDYRPLGWKAKFLGTAIAASIVIFGGHETVRDLGSYAGIGEISLGYFSIPFTYFCIIGVTNAINLMDGLNGLAGGVSLIGFLSMGIAGVLGNNYEAAVLAFSFVGAMAAFLRFNFPKARVFMGDSGSLFLGFSLAVLAIMLTQGKSSTLSPMFPILVLLIPVLDTLRVMAKRTLAGKNPFRADKTHFHHLLVRKGWSHSHAVVLLWSLSAFFGLVALMMHQKTAMSFSFAVCAFSAALIVFIETLARRRKRQERQAGILRDTQPELLFNDAPGFADRGSFSEGFDTEIVGARDLRPGNDARRSPRERAEHLTH